MNKDKDSKFIFKIPDAYLLVRRIRPNPHIITAHNETLSSFALYINGRQIPPEGVSLNMGHEKTSVLGYKSCLKDPVFIIRTRDFR